MFLPQASVYAQSGGEDGKDLPTPYMMGNIIIVLFAIGLFALAAISSRRDFSAIPDEFGNRPNAKNRKKKGKQKLDFSHGPIKHPDLESTLKLTILGICTGFLLLFSIPAALRVKGDISGDPRFLGGGTAQALVVFNFIALAGWIIGIIVGIIVIIVVVLGGNSA